MGYGSMSCGEWVYRGMGMRTGCMEVWEWDSTHSLHGGGYGDDLLNSIPQSLSILPPV